MPHIEICWQSAVFLQGKRTDMKKLEIKHVRLIYDEWKCIARKSYRQKRVKNPDFSGFLALIDIEKVKEKQVWSWGKESLTVCDDGMKWLIIVPETGKYAVTVYMNQEYRPVVWYIDIIDGVGIDEDGMFFCEGFISGFTGITGGGNQRGRQG